MNAVKSRDFEVAFGTWAASFNRPEEFLNMAHRLLIPEMERFPQLRAKIADLEQTIFLADGPERDRQFIHIFNEIQDMAIINPVYKIHIPLLHSCRIESHVAAWQFHPRLESLMLKGEL
ncbi:MAG: hypothetical protein M3Q07_25760 [Pseudobdellovibrionaceae bacterium]|nr:hypothetical protein [Pseudobdellovibrionaceae bacterium]